MINNGNKKQIFGNEVDINGYTNRSIDINNILSQTRHDKQTLQKDYDIPIFSTAFFQSLKVSGMDFSLQILSKPFKTS